MREANFGRISLRVGALSDVDYGRFISTLRTAVEPVLRAYDTRHELLRSLTTGPDGRPIEIDRDDRILVLGRSKPKPESRHSFLKSDAGQQPDVAMVQDDTVQDSLIDTEAIFLSTLSELLQAEQLPSAKWVDPTTSDKPIDFAGEKWAKLVSAFGTVIWVGDDQEVFQSLSSAKRLINAREIYESKVNAKLIGDRIPAVAGPDDTNHKGMHVVYTGVIPCRVQGATHAAGKSCPIYRDGLHFDCLRDDCPAQPESVGRARVAARKFRQRRHGRNDFHDSERLPGTADLWRDGTLGPTSRYRNDDDRFGRNGCRC